MSQANPPTPPSQPTFNPEAEHQNKPKIRPLRGFAAKNGDQQLLGLADARNISTKVVLAVPQFQVVLPHLRGEKTIDEVVAEVGHGLTREVLEPFVAQLDDAGLLEGPTFDAILKEVREQFDESDTLPPATTADVADALVAQAVGEGVTDEQKAEMGPEKLREAFDQWIAKALEPVEDPSFNALPKAIIAPHLDYWRGWLNYAHVYGRMRVVDKPDRVVILGTNHFGMGTGVTACDKGFESPLGTCAYDKDFAELVGGALSDDDREKLFANRYDHEREHSIELHIPWICHVFGGSEGEGPFPKVFAALVHDPLANNGESYDGEGLAIDPFVDALKKALSAADGTTLVIASADLSHVGPQFGDQVQLLGDDDQTKQFRIGVINHDRELVKMLEEAKTDELVTSMAWQQNKTRWCSVGNLVATLRAVEADKVDLLNYAAAVDQQGSAMVSSMAGVVRAS